MLSTDELEKMVLVAHSYTGKRVKVDESISRSRDVGRHDRHFASHSHFTIDVEDVVVIYSGAQLAFLGPDARYGISLDSVVAFEGDETALEIVEHFEEKTERRTRITAE